MRAGREPPWYHFPGSNSQHMNSRSSMQEYNVYRGQPVNSYRVGGRVVDHRSQVPAGRGTVYFPQHIQGQYPRLHSPYGSYLNRASPLQDHSANEGEYADGDGLQHHPMNQPWNQMPAERGFDNPRQNIFAQNASESHFTSGPRQCFDSSTFPSYSNIHQRPMSDVQRSLSSAYEASTRPGRTTDGNKGAVISNSEPVKCPFPEADRAKIDPGRQRLLENKNSPHLEYENVNDIPIRERHHVEANRFEMEMTGQNPSFENSNIHPSQSQLARTANNKNKRQKEYQKLQKQQEVLAQEREATRERNKLTESLHTSVQEQNKTAEIERLKRNNTAYQDSIRLAMRETSYKAPTESTSLKLEFNCRSLKGRAIFQVKESFIPCGKNTPNSSNVELKHDERFRGGESTERYNDPELHTQQRASHHTDNRPRPDQNEPGAEGNYYSSRASSRSASATLSDLTFPERNRSNKSKSASEEQSSGDSAEHKPTNTEHYYLSSRAPSPLPEAKRRGRSERTSPSSNSSERRRSKYQKHCFSNKQAQRSINQKRMADDEGDTRDFTRRVVKYEPKIKCEDEDNDTLRLQDVPEPSTQDQQDSPPNATSNAHIPITTNSSINHARASSVKLEIIEQRVCGSPENSTRAIPTANEEDPILKHAPKGPRNDINSNVRPPGQRQRPRHSYHHESTSQRRQFRLTEVESWGGPSQESM